VRLDGDRISAEVEDDGRAFNPLKAPAPDLGAGLDRGTTGGFGLHIVRSLMDAIDYRREGGRNIITMTKRLATGGGTGSSS
jgi:serine/threonine-protein kinase RsbW